MELHYRWTWSLPGAPEALWPLVTDTDRFNRDSGLPPVEDARAPGETLPNARRRLGFRVKGFRLEWEELPFEWLRPSRFGVVRRYSRGPVREMRVLALLESSGKGRTSLTYDVVVVPRGILGRLATPIQIGILSRVRFKRTFERYAREATAAPSPAVPKRRPRGASRSLPLKRRLSEEGVPDAIAERLLDHVLRADDRSLARIRAYELADLWELDRRAVLSACLRATRCGLLDMRWNILCPACRGVTDGADTLRKLHTGAAHCETCRIEFSPDFDQAVEITFRPTPAVRRVEAPRFCVAGPQVTPHVEVQQLLAPGEVREVSALLHEGRHRARAFGIEGGPSFRVEHGAGAEIELAVRDGAWSPTGETVAPHAHVLLANHTGEERLFVVERISWADTAATAAEVTALAEFRDLFASEVLEVGSYARVGSLAVLFTDLKGSTSMYRTVGDAAAFGRVMHHFDLLRDAVLAEDGAVVKTIGDAVMAVFRTPVEAVRAALRAHRALAAPDEAVPAPLVLKVGVHYGPCISVTQNERLDYFGTTVNVAARLEGLSSGRDVVLSDDVRRDLDVERLLSREGASLSSLRTEIRGLDEKLLVWRVTVPTEADLEEAPVTRAGGAG